METLTQKEQKELVELGRRLLLCLSCDTNDTGLPCRTDRLAAVELMRRYVEIHDTP